MKYKTQNLVFYTIAAVLVSFLFTCKPFASGDYDESDRGGITYTDVEYSPDGGSVTIYLDGSMPVRHSRALTRDLAVIGHDFFEVAFHHPDSGTIARAAWETGHAAGVNGVRRNVSYIRAYSDGAVFAGNQGAAIIFVGKKSDRTLLAVGSLTHVDGIAGTLIGPNAKTVTFSVAALKAGVSEARGPSSFKTDAIGGGGGLGGWGDPNSYMLSTDVFYVTIGRYPFPLFRVDENAVGGQYIHGSYTFEVATPTTGDFNNYYRRGIFQKGNMVVPNDPIVINSKDYRRVPRYSIGKNNWETCENSLVNKLVVDVDPAGINETKVTPRNITPANTPFQNPALFEIGPTLHSMDGKVFSFTFEIPVYPLTDDDSRHTGFSWYLRPGYDSYKYDLDDGLGGNGGAILIGTGKFEESTIYNLYIRKPPDKTKYNSAPWTFDLTNIDIQLRIGEGARTVSTDPDLWYVLHSIDTSETVVIGHGASVVGQGNNLLALFQNTDFTVNGALKVFVRYYGDPIDKKGQEPFTGTPLQNNPLYNGDEPYTGSFMIYYFNLAGSGITDFTIPDNHRRVIVDSEDVNRLINDGFFNASGGSYLLVFFAPLDFAVPPLPVSTEPFFIVVLAGAENVVLGRASPNGAFINQRNGNIFYIGMWPFDEILTVQGTAVDSKQFIINAGGPFADVAKDGKGNYIPEFLPSPTNLGNYFLSGNFSGTVHRTGVDVLEHAPNQFSQLTP